VLALHHAAHPGTLNIIWPVCVAAMQCCLVYSCDQTEYNVNEELQTRISSKQVRCLEEGCCFQSTLAEYLLHGHGKAAYSNADVDFSCLRPRLFRPPSATAETSSQAGLSTSIRSQLLQVIIAIASACYINLFCIKKR